MLTTTIGAFPKPDYVPISDWFTNTDGDYTSAYLAELSAGGDKADALLDEATRDVVQAQVGAGIDIPTDGEIRRENYIHYQCRAIEGIDFRTLTPVRMRGTTDTLLPTITGPVAPLPSPLAEDYRRAQSAVDNPVKITIPGPMTIIDSTANTHYQSEMELAHDLATVINQHVHQLAAAGCTWIQVDEPVMVRRPDEAQRWGIDELARCFQGLDPSVNRVVHICCGYPNRLDQDDYEKAPQASYLDLAERLDEALVDFVSLEDAHRHNNLAQLLPRFPRTSVVLGVVAIASSRVETVEEIAARLETALGFAAGPLIAAPDCGLGYLSRATALAKLEAMAAAARSL